MDDNDIQDSYEVNEFMIDDSCPINKPRSYYSKQQSSPVPSKNGLYLHESDGSKSFGAGTGILILMVLIVGIVIALATKNSYPLIGAIAALSSLVIVFKLILGGKRPEQ